MHIDMQPQMDNKPDHEGAMARADLYKLANYSLKLFKMMDSNTQLEGWVQAKITKAADYIASVYHYLEYEMKFSEYGQAIDDSDVYSESQKRQLKNKLLEAKEKIKDLKKAQAEKIKKKDAKEKISEARATDKKKGAVTKSEKSQYFAKITSKDGKVTKGSTHEAGEGESEGDVRDRVERDAKSKGDTVDSFRKKELDEAKAKKAKKDYDKDGKVETEKDEVIGSRRRAAGLPVKEAMAPSSPDGATAPPPKGKDGQYPVITSGPNKGKRWSPNAPGPTNPNFKEASEKCNHTAKGKSCPVHGLKECGSMYEAKKEEKFDALKHVKNPTKGEKDAAKDVKRGSYGDRAAMLKSAEADDRLKEAKGKKPDFLDMDKDGDKKEPMKKAVGDKKGTAPKKGVNPFAKK